MILSAIWNKFVQRHVYLFQNAQEKSCDQLLIIHMKEFEKVKQKQRTHITQSRKKVITHLAF